MASIDSHETGSASSGSLGFGRLAQLVAGDLQYSSTSKRASMLLPLVRRALETGRGPSCLVDWIQQSKANSRWREYGDQLACALSEELAESMCGPGDRRAETVRGL